MQSCLLVFEFCLEPPPENQLDTRSTTPTIQISRRYADTRTKGTIINLYSLALIIAYIYGYPLTDPISTQ